MKGLIRGAAGLVAVLAFSGCTSDQTIDLMGPPTGIQATPASAFTLKGDSTAIVVRMVNDRNQAVPTKFDVSNVGSAISVAYDAKYRPDYSGGDTLSAPEIKPQQRYFAKGVATGTATFTITSGGLSTTVTVVVRPKDLGPALNRTTGLTYGDTVTITATDGLKFTPQSVVTFASGLSSLVPPAASDSTTRKVVLGAGTGGVATVTNVYQSYAPTLAKVSLATTNAVVATPALAKPTMAPTAGLVAGSIVTITAGAGTVFSRTPVITFATGAVAVQSVSADSSTVNIILGPGVAGAATITKMGIIKGPLVGVYTVTTANTLSAVPAIAFAPTTVSDLAPSIGVPITVTLGGGLRFIANSHIFIGGVEAGLHTVSADSSTATVVPMMGSTGLVTYTNIALSFLTAVPLALPGDKNIALGAAYAGPSDPNATTLATASTVDLPPVGRSFVLSDAGSLANASACGGIDGCRQYKIVVPAARTYVFQVRWQGGSDMGLYRLNSTGGGATSMGGCDNGGQGGGGQPENCTAAALAAGTYYLQMQYYGTIAGYPPSGNTVPPAFYQIRITAQ